MSENILIVDDDDFFRQIINEILVGAGYEVVIAEDGLVAWEMIKNDPARFNLILLDKNMPNLDGLSFLRLIKAENSTRELPVIILTGDNHEQGIIEGLKEGAYYYLIKPTPATMLKTVVRNALDEHAKKLELIEEIDQYAFGLHSLRTAEFFIRTIEEAKNLAIVLADASLDPKRTVSGYSELLINAVEHGNLGITYTEKSGLLHDGIWEDEVERRLNISPYSERQVCISVVRHKNEFTVTISDEGNGFDWCQYLEFDPHRVFDLHGRGIAMSKSMSFDDIRYIGSGNTVVTSVIAPHCRNK